ncbi:hypothetical protein ASD07_10795 [Duganella sp. Root336D2]|nr:hypothetical protein ASD07_10795 [Duganella sp. Root336D2]
MQKPIMKNLLIVFVLSTLTACATSFSVMDETLPKLVGKKSSEAVKYLGFPSGEQSVMGKKVYVWSTRTWMPNFAPATTNTTGTIGARPFTATSTTYGGGGGMDLSCELKLIVGESEDLIERFQYEGNNGACMRFSEALKPLKGT